MKGNTSLTSLDLSNNNFGELGGIYLGGALVSISRMELSEKVHIKVFLVYIHNANKCKSISKFSITSISSCLKYE